MLTMLAAVMMTACSHEQSDKTRDAPECGDNGSPLVTSTTAGLGYRTDTGAVSSFTLSIGMHSNTANACRSFSDTGKDTYLGSSITIGQEN